jgi:hypothetical protein
MNEVTDLMRFREKEKRNQYAIDYMNDNTIDIIDLNIFEAGYEFILYIRYKKIES